LGPAMRIAVTALLLAVVSQAHGVWRHRHTQRVQIRFLATSTLIRGTWGMNEDTYLAQLRLLKQNEVILVRLVDAYPNEWPSLARQALTSDAGVVFSVKRDTTCDRTFAQIPLRTAPGDLMAILPVPLSYQPQLQVTPAPGTIVPCYRILR
jgi:hypothetical protein